MRTRFSILVASCAIAAFAGCQPLIQDSSPLGDEEVVELVRVIDGDTIVVHEYGLEQRVRIIGIDTPEIGHGGSPDDCYAQEARQHLEDLLAPAATLTLRPDSTQNDTDRFGRLLRHVEVGDTSAALALIAAGAGREYTYDAPYAGVDEHRAAEDAARAASRGMWAHCR